MQDQTLNPFRAPINVGRAPRREAEPAPAPPIRLYRELAICFALFGIILVAYWGVWDFDFVYFDDPGYVTDNLNVVQGLPLFTDFKVFCHSVYWAFTAFEQSNWHPLTWLSHMLDVQLYGLNAGGHHITNIILHVSNTLLLFWLLRILTGRSWCSAAVAALFAVHPMHVESVAWIAERKDVLSTFFGLLTLLAYVRYSRKADLAKDSLYVIGVLSVVTWALAVFGIWWLHNVMNYQNFINSGGKNQELLTRLAASWVRILQTEGAERVADAMIWPASTLWIYVPIFAGVILYAAISGRYNMLLYCLVFCLYAVGLLAKPMLVTLPFVCLLLDFWPLNRFASVIAGGRPAVPRRRAKRNQRLPVTKAAARVETVADRPVRSPIFLLLLEKVPLFALCAVSTAITPYAQAHGGSMASASELSPGFRFENSMQSYMIYITKMFWPGKMTVLYLLDPERVNHWLTVVSVLGLLLITGLVIWGTYLGRRYLAVGWFWYVGILVPVIGFVQVGEQTYADRYTYVPYVGIFIIIVWGIADLIRMLPARVASRFAAGFVLTLALAACVGWTKYQLQFWPEVEIHLRHALSITPDNWNMLNNLGVKLWKKGQEEDREAGKAAAEGNQQEAEKHHANSVAFKKDAEEQWIHGITSRPTATDIHSNLGYMYSERGDLDKAEFHLTEAVRLKPISPRPHNNLGRVLLRRSQQAEVDAREADAKSKIDLEAAEAKANTDKTGAEKLKLNVLKDEILKSGLTMPQFRQAQAAKVKPLRELSQAKLKAAIDQFEEAVRLDPSLLEARLNLGEVYIQLSERDKADSSKFEQDLDKAESEYREILKLDSPSVKDTETISNFSQGYFGLARIALARKRPDEAIDFLKKAIEKNPQNQAAMRLLVNQLFELERFREAEQVLWPLLAQQPKAARPSLAVMFCKQFDDSGKAKQALEACNFFGWAFATSPDAYHLIDPKEALRFAQIALQKTNQQDPMSLDTMAAALAAAGDFNKAVQAANAAEKMANSQGNRPLAEAIARRLQFYQQGQPYRCDPSGSDRP